MSPADEEIAASIKKQSYQLWDIQLTKTNDKSDDNNFYARIFSKYIAVNQRIFSALNVKHHVMMPQIAYTPMHGVGLEVARALTESFGVTLISVPSQAKPDPDFSTCTFPNPEEGGSAYAEAIKFSNSNLGIKLIFANDPDADRFNFAELDESNDNWRIFTGNEIAAILAHFIWTHRQELAPRAKSFAMINTCVSSKLLQAMGAKEGFKVKETLTGFKYIANAAQQIEKEEPGTKVLLAYEEAIGYMVNTEVWDKDGISTLLLVTFLVRECYGTGQRLAQRLEQIYQEYGYFTQFNSYYTGKVSQFCGIFANIRRRLNGTSEIPSDISGPCTVKSPTGIPIVSIKDYIGTNMITLYLDGGGLSWITFRASGTEPKIKFYSELMSDWNTRHRTTERLHNIATDLCEWLLEPKINELSIQGS